MQHSTQPLSVNPTMFDDRKPILMRQVYRIAFGMMEAEGFERVAIINSDDPYWRTNLNHQGQEVNCECARIYQKNGNYHIIYFPGTDAHDDPNRNHCDIDLKAVKNEALEKITNKIKNDELHFDLNAAHHHFFIAEALEYKSIPKAAKHYVYGYLHDKKLVIEDSMNFLDYDTASIINAITDNKPKSLDDSSVRKHGTQSSLTNTCGHFVTRHFLRNVDRIQGVHGRQKGDIVIMEQTLFEQALYHQQINPAKYRSTYEDKSVFARHYILKNVLIFGIVLLGVAGLVVGSVATAGLLPGLALLIGFTVGGVLVATGAGLKIFDVVRRWFKQEELKQALDKNLILDKSGRCAAIISSLNNNEPAQQVVRDDLESVPHTQPTEKKKASETANGFVFVGSHDDENHQDNRSSFSPK